MTGTDRHGEQRFAYPSAVVLADYARAGAGLVATATPLFLLDLASPLFFVFLGAAGLFAAFGMRTLLRQMSGVTLTDRELRVTGPLPTAVRGDALSGLELRYFSTRRDRAKGWMQLTLRGGSRPVRVDSQLDGFEQLVRWAARRANAAHLELSEATRTNLAAMGLAAMQGSSPLSDSECPVPR